MSSSVNLLALDTSSDACSVAVLCGDEIKVVGTVDLSLIEKKKT